MFMWRNIFLENSTACVLLLQDDLRTTSPHVAFKFKWLARVMVRSGTLRRQASLSRLHWLSRAPNRYCLTAQTAEVVGLRI